MNMNLDSSQPWHSQVKVWVDLSHLQTETKDLSKGVMASYRNVVHHGDRLLFKIVLMILTSAESLRMTTWFQNISNNTAVA